MAGPRGGRLSNPPRTLWENLPACGSREGPTEEAGPLATLVLTGTPRRHGLGFGGVSRSSESGGGEQPETAAGPGHHGRARLAGGARGGGRGGAQRSRAAPGRRAGRVPDEAVCLLGEVAAR